MKKLEVTGGVGIINTWNEQGKFEVVYSDTKRLFKSYYEAVATYNKLNEPAAIFDKTSKTLLLEKKNWVEEET